MGENSNIEWTTHTFNPWIGCTKVSPGCDHCYAEAMMDTRWRKVKWGPHGDRVRSSEANWRLPLRWAKAARADLLQAELDHRPAPARPRVFCASLADVFDNQVPAAWREDLWTLIAMTPELDWLLLTKRPENIRKMLPGSCIEQMLGRDLPWPWPNVWLGFTAEDQEHFDRRWPIVREIPAVVRFCSYEPAIGPLRPVEQDHGNRWAQGLHWLICGGESGPGHREMPDAWECVIRNDCADAGIAYFFKQRSGKRPIPASYQVIRQFPEGTLPYVPRET